METWIKCVLLIYFLLIIATVITACIFGIPSKPLPEIEWSEIAKDFRDNYLGPPCGYCILKKTGMPPGPITKAYALITCVAEKLANRTDHVVDLNDIRSILVTYCVDKGYFATTTPHNYSEACLKGLSIWESGCQVPYALDCAELVSFIEKNHDLIATCLSECGY